MHTKQRGSGWSIRLALWIYSHFGYMTFFVLLYPITFLYYLKASNTRCALKLYYRKIGIKYTQWRYFEHLRKFAVVMTDRFITKCDASPYKLIVDRDNVVKELKEGGVILFSHFGGWSVLPELLKVDDLRVNVIMQEVIKEDIKVIEKEISAGNQTNVHILDLAHVSKLEASIKIAEALIQKEAVSMMGDRANNLKHAISVDFFGSPAEFNKTPFEIAQKAQVPIRAFFITYVKAHTYKLEYVKIKISENIEDMVKEYAKAYEKVICAAPDQWFNLYDFWKEEAH
ncbi:MAG: lysophospholipid acyltransferase family protein [Campylobacteraceae bacterium]|jgi:predicted LPLAT superfamily acyltransferase|nr:lysophospholipid acyltransferase family protein [Campylobacteraceae bacterium]